MAQKIKQANIFGRLGTGIGKGIAEQVPKEIERTRLAGGLKELGQQQNLSPFQQFAQLSSIPGVTPQMIQSGTDLLRQQARGQALAQGNKPAQMQPSPFPQASPKNLAPGSEIPSITQQQPLEQIQEGYIPPTQDEIIADAGRRFNKNPALYNNDPQKAIEAAESAALRNQQRFEAFQKQHENLSKIQDNVVSRLRNQSEKLGVDVPGRTFSNIEDKAIQATKPKSQGGRGLTEQQAIKEYGKELDDVSRDYQAVEDLGDWGIVARPAKETLTNIKNLQKKFDKNNDTENFADTLISKNKLSPKFAYALAEPVSRQPELARELKNTPSMKGKLTFAGGGGGLALDPTKIKEAREKTLSISEKLAPLLGDKGSPLAVAYELEKKGLDPQIWLKYVVDNREKLNLKESQGRQLDKSNPLAGTLNDWWLSEFSGVEE